MSVNGKIRRKRSRSRTHLQTHLQTPHHQTPQPLQLYDKYGYDKDGYDKDGYDKRDNHRNDYRDNGNSNGGTLYYDDKNNVMHIHMTEDTDRDVDTATIFMNEAEGIVKNIDNQIKNYTNDLFHTNLQKIKASILKKHSLDVVSPKMIDTLISITIDKTHERMVYPKEITYRLAVNCKYLYAIRYLSIIRNRLKLREDQNNHKLAKQTNEYNDILDEFVIDAANDIVRHYKHIHDNSYDISHDTVHNTTGDNLMTVKIIRSINRYLINNTKDSYDKYNNYDYEDADYLKGPSEKRKSTIITTLPGGRLQYYPNLDYVPRKPSNDETVMIRGKFIVSEKNESMIPSLQEYIYDRIYDKYEFNNEDLSVNKLQYTNKFKPPTAMYSNVHMIRILLEHGVISLVNLNGKVWSKAGTRLQTKLRTKMQSKMQTKMQSKMHTKMRTKIQTKMRSKMQRLDTKSGSKSKSGTKSGTKSGSGLKSEAQNFYIYQQKRALRPDVDRDRRILIELVTAGVKIISMLTHGNNASGLIINGVFSGSNHHFAAIGKVGSSKIKLIACNNNIKKLTMFDKKILKILCVLDHGNKCGSQYVMPYINFNNTEDRNTYRYCLQIARTLKNIDNID